MAWRSGLSIKLTDDMMLTPAGCCRQKRRYNGFLFGRVYGLGADRLSYPSYSAPPIVLPSLVPTNFTQGTFFQHSGGRVR